MNIPLPIWEALKWILIISCACLWLKHLVNDLIYDEEELEKKKENRVKERVETYVNKVLGRG